MKTQHTPGPWHLKSNIVCANVQHVTVSIETPIADVCTTGAERWREEEEANARLIAAAPELLEVLEGTLQGLQIMQQNNVRFHNTENDEIKFMIEGIQATIKKAKGE